MAKLYFKYGAMGSSKTATALITKYNYEERGMRVWLIKPAADRRDGEFTLRSRIGLTAQCEAIGPECDLRERYAAHGKADVEKVDRRVDPAELRQDLVDRPDVGEQHIKQHRERRCHDEVRHINDGLKELLALDLQAVARKEAREHQRDHDLRDRAADPECNGISRIFQNVDRSVFIRRKERDVVLQADEIRPDLRQTLPVVFKKAVVDRQQLWCEVKQRIRQKERRDKNIAPLCIADFGSFGFQFGCFCRLHQISSSYSQT